jgi:hypothetical protein
MQSNTTEKPTAVEINFLFIYSASLSDLTVAIEPRRALRSLRFFGQILSSQSGNRASKEVCPRLARVLSVEMRRSPHGLIATLRQPSRREPKRSYASTI